MSGPKPSYPIALTASEERQLRRLAAAHKTGQSAAVRARILLTAHEHPEWSNQAIAKEVGTTDRTVRKWRSRWTTTHTLHDAPRSGAPRRYGATERATATAVACSLPRTQDVPLSRWSRAAIARHIRTKFQATGRPTPSARTIGRWLTAEKIRPWRYHSWQHIHDLEAFERRARPILQLYASAKTLLQKGTWLLCLDEKTSIQARQGETAPRPATPDAPQLQESRYIRKGAKHLFAAFSVADGKVFGQTRDRKRFLDFQTFLIERVIPEALRQGMQVIHLILDKGTTHAPKQLENWLNQLPEVKAGKLSFCVSWLPVNARDGWTKWKFGSPSCSVSFCPPTILKAERTCVKLLTPLSLTLMRRPNPSDGPETGGKAGEKTRNAQAASRFGDFFLDCSARCVKSRTTVALWESRLKPNLPTRSGLLSACT